MSIYAHTPVRTAEIWKKDFFKISWKHFYHVIAWLFYFFVLYGCLCLNVSFILFLFHKQMARSVFDGMKNEKNVPFPAPYCIFLRTYLLKMFFGKRRKWHFRDLEFKNILGNMRPDSLFWSAFRRSNFSSCAYSFYAPSCPKTDFRKMIQRSQR